MNKTLTATQIATVMEIVDDHFGIYPADDPMRDRFAQAMRALLATHQPAPRAKVTFDDWFKAEFNADRMHGSDEEIARAAWNAARAGEGQ